MVKEKATSGSETSNRTYRFSAKTLKRLAEISEKLEITDNACIQLAILRLWEAEFPEKRNTE